MLTTEWTDNVYL